MVVVAIGLFEWGWRYPVDKCYFTYKRVLKYWILGLLKKVAPDKHWARGAVLMKSRVSDFNTFVVL